jgi:hypothetical protein
VAVEGEVRDELLRRDALPKGREQDGIRT